MARWPRWGNNFATHSDLIFFSRRSVVDTSGSLAFCTSNIFNKREKSGTLAERTISTLVFTLHPFSPLSLSLSFSLFLSHALYLIFLLFAVHFALPCCASKGVRARWITQRRLASRTCWFPDEMHHQSYQRFILLFSDSARVSRDGTNSDELEHFVTRIYRRYSRDALHSSNVSYF